MAIARPTPEAHFPLVASPAAGRDVRPYPRGDNSEVTVQPDSRRLIEQHLALVASAAVVVFAGLRVLYFASFNVEAALSILSVANRTNIIVSTVIFILGTLGPSLLMDARFRAWLYAGNRDGAPFAIQLRTAVLGIPLAGYVAAFLRAATALGIGSAIAVAVLLIRRRRRARRLAGESDRPTGETSNGFGWLFATAIGAVLLLGLSRPWQALERFTLAGANPIVGYMIGEQAQMSLIVERGGALTWVPTEKLQRRELCAPTPQPWYWQSLSSIPRGGEVDCGR